MYSIIQKPIKSFLEFRETIVYTRNG